MLGWNTTRWQGLNNICHHAFFDKSKRLCKIRKSFVISQVGELGVNRVGPEHIEDPNFIIIVAADVRETHDT